MKFLETSDPIQLEDLIVIEKELKIKFPDKFKEHYLKYNGGYPEKRFFVWEKNVTTRINTFFTIKHEDLGSLESTYKDLVILEKYLPEGIVPFACDDGGNFFCISLRNRDYDHVYYCDNNHYNVIDNEEYLTLLTNSFNDFLKELI